MPEYVPYQDLDTSPRTEENEDAMYGHITFGGAGAVEQQGDDIPAVWLNRLLPSTEPMQGIDWQAVFGRVFILNDDGVFKPLKEERLVNASQKTKEFKQEPARRHPYNLGDILQQFTSLPLSRIHHYANTGEYLRLLFAHRKLIDVHIRVNDKLFPAHRVALACHSVYFARAFILNQHQKHALTEIRLKNISTNAFYAILRFIYTGKLAVNEQNVDDLIEVARQLQVPAVLYKCLDFLGRMPVKKTEGEKKEPASQKATTHSKEDREKEMASETAKEQAEEDEEEELDPETARKQAGRWQRMNLFDLLHDENFLREPVEVLEMILGDDNVQIDSELDVFNAAIAWLAYDIGPRRRQAERVMRHVRFTCMTPAEIIHATQVNTFIRNSPFCRNRVLEATWLMTVKGYKTFDVFDCPCPRPRRCLENRGPQPPIIVETLPNNAAQVYRSNNASTLPWSSGHYAATVYKISREKGSLHRPVVRSVHPEDAPQFSLHQRKHDPSSDMLNRVFQEPDDASFNFKMGRNSTHQHIPTSTPLEMNVLYPSNPGARANFCQSSGGERGPRRHLQRPPLQMQTTPMRGRSPPSPVASHSVQAQLARHVYGGVSPQSSYGKPGDAAGGSRHRGRDPGPSSRSPSVSFEGEIYVPTVTVHSAPSLSTLLGHPPSRSPLHAPQIEVSQPPPPPPPASPPPPPPVEFEDVPVVKICSSRFSGHCFEGDTKRLEVNFKRIATSSVNRQSTCDPQLAATGEAGVPPDGDLLAVGGFMDSSNRKGSSLAQRLDSSQQKWEQFSTIPETRLNFAAAFLYNKIYICGGYDPQNSGTGTKATTDTFMFDQVFQLWERGGNMLYPRAFHGVCVLDGRLFAVGGQDHEERALKTAEVYDPQADRWSLVASMAYCRVGTCAAAFQERVMAVGGYGMLSSRPEEACPVLATTEWFEPEINRWQRRGSLRLPRAQACLVAHGPYLYLCGGATSQPDTGGVLCSIPDIDRYNPDTDQWTHVTNLQTARHNAGATAIGTKIYVVGGVSTNINQVLRSVECYDTATETLDTSLPELPLGAKSVACIVISR